MKAIILAAGKSTRMHPLTLTTPKPLLKILNKTILEHNLESLKGIISEAIIVVGYKKEMIINAIGKKFQGIKITYIEQKEQLGTGHAVLCAKGHITKGEKFLIVPGDDLFSKKDIQNIVKHDLCVLAKEVSDAEKWGIFVVDKKNNITGIEEKPANPKSNLASTGLMVMDFRLLNSLMNQKKTKRGEIEIPSALNELVKKEKVFCKKVEDYWIPVGYPWNILEATEFLMKKINKSDIKGKIEKNVFIDGKIILGKESVILPGTYIEGNVMIGKNCKIGPNAYIRGATTIGDNCRVGPSEVKNSVFYDDVRCDHVSYVGDSVLGNHAHLGAHTIIANLRHDKKNIKSMVKSELIDTGRRKLGVIMGDNSHTGVNTSVYPGRKIWPFKFTVPSETLTKDKVE